MSASSSPTLAPALARATARFTLTVDLPTPPFPEAMATLFLTPGIPPWPVMPWDAATFHPIFRVIRPMPGIPESASRHACSISPLKGQAGVVSTTSRLTSEPSIRISRISFIDTRSFPSSGSFTADKAWRTTCSVSIGGSPFAGPSSRSTLPHEAIRRNHAKAWPAGVAFGRGVATDVLPFVGACREGLAADQVDGRGLEGDDHRAAGRQAQFMERLLRHKGNHPAKGGIRGDPEANLGLEWGDLLDPAGEMVAGAVRGSRLVPSPDRSEEHTSELQSPTN